MESKSKPLYTDKSYEQYIDGKVYNDSNKLHTRDERSQCHSMVEGRIVQVDRDQREKPSRDEKRKRAKTQPKQFPKVPKPFHVILEKSGCVN